MPIDRSKYKRLARRSWKSHLGTNRINTKLNRTDNQKHINNLCNEMFVPSSRQSDATTNIRNDQNLLTTVNQSLLSVPRTPGDVPQVYYHYINENDVTPYISRFLYRAKHFSHRNISSFRCRTFERGSAASCKKKKTRTTCLPVPVATNAAAIPR